MLGETLCSVLRHADAVAPAAALDGERQGRLRRRREHERAGENGREDDESTSQPQHWTPIGIQGTEAQ